MDDPTCLFCDEPVLPTDQQDPHAVIGSVAHFQRRCSCYVLGASCGDPEGMTKREAARAALKL
jgi:hypothetical protein